MAVKFNEFLIGQDEVADYLELVIDSNLNSDFGLPPIKIEDIFGFISFEIPKPANISPTTLKTIMILNKRYKTVGWKKVIVTETDLAYKIDLYYDIKI